MNWNNLKFWHNNLGWNITDIETVPLHEGNSGSQVWRGLLQGQGDFPPSIIIKHTLIPKRQSILTVDHLAWQREAHFYKLLSDHPEFPTAKVFYNSIDEENKTTTIIMEDLSQSFFIATSNHVWSTAEAGAIMKTYTMLHKLSKALLQQRANYEWLAAPEFTFVTPIDTLQTIRILSSHPSTAELCKPINNTIDCLQNMLPSLHSEYRKLKPTLSYNDFYPANIAVPLNKGPAVLFDWQLIGWGNPLNNMLNAFGHPSFGDDRKQLQLEYLQKVSFSNNTSFTFEQLVAVNDLLSSMYSLWLMSCYLKTECENYKLPRWLQSVVYNIPKQYQAVVAFV